MAEAGAASSQFGTESTLVGAVPAARESADQAAEHNPTIQGKDSAPFLSTNFFHHSQAQYKVPVPYPAGYYGPHHPHYVWGPQPAVMVPYGAPGAYYPGYPPPVPGAAPAYYTATPPKPAGGDGGNVTARRSSGSDSGSSGDDGRGDGPSSGPATYTYGPGGELQWGIGVRRGSASALNGDLGGGAFLDERELKRQRRKQSNRESARRSRLRKQAESEDLGRVKNNLSLENSNLKAEVQRLSERVALLTQDIVALIAQVQQAGLEPVRLASAEGTTEPASAMPPENTIATAMSIEQTAATTTGAEPLMDKLSEPARNHDQSADGEAAPKADPPAEALPDPSAEAL